MTRKVDHKERFVKRFCYMTVWMNKAHKRRTSSSSHQITKRHTTLSLPSKIWTTPGAPGRNCLSHRQRGENSFSYDSRFPVVITSIARELRLWLFDLPMSAWLSAWFPFFLPLRTYRLMTWPLLVCYVESQLESFSLTRIHPHFFPTQTLN